MNTMKRTNLFFVKIPKERKNTQVINRETSHTHIMSDGVLQICKKQFLLIFLGLFLIAGLILGVISVRHADYSLLKNLDFIFFSNVKARSTLPILSIFIASMASSFLFLLCCFLCGLSLWGAYCMPIVPLFRGFGIGIMSGYLYAAYGFSGFLFHLAVILPGAFICSIVLLIASRESMRFSKKMSLRKQPEQEQDGPKQHTRNFCVRFSILTGMLMVGALVDVLTTVCFAHLFVF